MIEPRRIVLGGDAGAALRQILGIMSDQAMAGGGWAWDLDHVLALDARLEMAWADDERAEVAIDLGIDDVSLILEGMAFTEIASEDLPWIDMVRWTSDFITAELRPHWTDEEWKRFEQPRPMY